MAGDSRNMHRMFYPGSACTVCSPRLLNTTAWLPAAYNNKAAFVSIYLRFSSKHLSISVFRWIKPTISLWYLSPLVLCVLANFVALLPLPVPHTSAFSFQILTQIKTPCLVSQQSQQIVELEVVYRQTISQQSQIPHFAPSTCLMSTFLPLSHNRNPTVLVFSPC